MSKLSKLRVLTLNEVRVRGSQKLAALRERAGWSSLARVPNDPDFLRLIDSTQTGHELWSPQELLEHFRTRSKPNFFAGMSERAATVAEINGRWSKIMPDIVERADRILDGRFDLLGLRDVSFGAPIDWHFEPLAEKRTPLIHWSKLDYLDAGLAGDKKIVWELNRHQYFMTLGQAYWLTGDERYAQGFVADLELWMEQNPPKLGINWASSLEIAFRSISWLWAFYFFKDSRSLSSRTFVRSLKFLYLNARHLETYLSTYFSPNTHLTGEALGLVYLGVLLPEFKESGRWRELGARIMTEQLPIHARPDGVYFEQSSYYHRYTVDFYLHFLILSTLQGKAITNEVKTRMTALLDHLMYITQPDGTTPFFGDDDGGRLVVLDRRPANDFRAALSTAAALLNRSDYKFVAGEAAEETLWLLGAESLQRFDNLQANEPALQSVAFKDGGYYVMRDEWTAKANYLLFDCGPHGQANCGHAHADALAFELAANGKTLLVDPGTYTYTGSGELRDWFRSSAAHNTLTIDGRSSSISEGPFSWKSIARCEPLAWLSVGRFDYVAGSHNGYMPAAHERDILFLKHDYWIIRDRLESEVERAVDLRFHFDSGTDPLIEAGAGQDAFVAELSNETGLDIHTFAKNGHWRREEGSVSHCYSLREPSRIYVYSATLKSGNIISFLLPQTAGFRRQVREIEAVGGLAFEVTNDNCLDIVMIRTSARVETARLASDFEWSWVRFSGQEDGILLEMLLLGGTTLAVEGQQILKTNERIDYFLARRLADEFRVETEEGIAECQLPIADFGSLFGNLHPVKGR